jgi:hypothetical protein
MSLFHHAIDFLGPIACFFLITSPIWVRWMESRAYKREWERAQKNRKPGSQKSA